MGPYVHVLYAPFSQLPPKVFFRTLWFMTQADVPGRLRCCACKRWLPRGWFRRSGEGRRDSRCRACRKGSDSAHAARRRGAGVKQVTRYQVEKLLARQLHRCAICKGWLIEGNPRDPWHVDHIVPIAAGGKHVSENLQLTHARCNLRKGAKLIDSAGAPFSNSGASVPGGGVRGAVMRSITPPVAGPIQPAGIAASAADPPAAFPSADAPEGGEGIGRPSS